MERLKERKNPQNSKKKIASAILLFDQYVDERIETIKVWTPNLYTFNEKWSVNITTNKVERVYPDPDF